VSQEEINSSNLATHFENCEAFVTVSDGSWLNWPCDLTALSNQLLQLTLNHELLEGKIEFIDADNQVEVSFLFTTDAEIQSLNKNFRGKDNPTNVLSFPDTELTPENLKNALMYEEPLLLGDIALAEETILKEALAQEKTAIDHLTHLILHGILHLLGYDHVIDSEAEKMEQQEIRLLSELGIQNPYL
jgi:probable rRNA maturation factor